MILYAADHLQIGRKTMNFKGIVLGALSFLIIGVWHPIVIKGEYHLGRKMCMPLFRRHRRAVCGSEPAREEYHVQHRHRAFWILRALGYP